MLERQPAARPHLAFVSFGDGNGNARWEPASMLPAAIDDLAVHCGIEVHACGMFGLVMGNGKAFGILELGYMDNEMIGHSSV